MRTLMPAAVLVLTAGLVACSGTPRAAQDPASSAPSAGARGAFSIQLGDCLKEPGAGATEGEELAPVPCDQPHEAEVYARFDLPDGPFPGGPAVTAAADGRCSAEFATYVGKPVTESTLEFYTFQPTESTWNAQSDREVLCVVSDPEGPTTNRLKGAAR